MALFCVAVDKQGSALVYTSVLTELVIENAGEVSIGVIILLHRRLVVVEISHLFVIIAIEDANLCFDCVELSVHQLVHDWHNSFAHH